MHYATYGRSRYRRKNNINTRATSYEKSADRRRVASKQSTTATVADVEKKKNRNRKEMMTTSWGQHISVAKDDDSPTAVVTDDADNNNSSRERSRHRSTSPATVSSSLRDSYVSSSSSSTTPTLQSTSCSGCSGSNQSSSYSDSGSSVYSKDDASVYSGNNSSDEDDSYSSQSYHTSPTIDQDTNVTSSSYSASIGYKRSLTWNGKTFHPHNTNNDNRVSSSFVHKSNHNNELNNSNSRENSGRTIAAKKWLGFDMISKKKNIIAKKKKFSFGSSKHSGSDEDDVYDENNEEDGSFESGEGSIYNEDEESIHSSDDESQEISYSTGSDDESSIGSNISTTQYESKPSFLRSSMKKIGTTSNQCKKVLSNVKIPIMLISGSSCKKMMMKKQSLLHDSYEGSGFNDDEMNLSNYLSKTRKSLEQHQSTRAPNDDGYTDGSMTYCSSSDGRISYDVEDGGEDEEEDGSSREDNGVCSGSERQINEEQVEDGDLVDEIKNDDDADDSSSMIQQKLSIEEECIIEELLHENERLCKSFAILCFYLLMTLYTNCSHYLVSLFLFCLHRQEDCHAAI